MLGGRGDRLVRGPAVRSFSDPGVVAIATQSFWLCGDDRGATRRCVPDAMLRLVSGEFVVIDVVLHASSY